MSNSRNHSLFIRYLWYAWFALIIVFCIVFRWHILAFFVDPGVGILRKRYSKEEGTFMVLRSIRDIVVAVNIKHGKINTLDEISRYRKFDIPSDEWGNLALYDATREILFSSGPDGKYTFDLDDEVNRDNIYLDCTKHTGEQTLETGLLTEEMKKR